MAGWLHCGRLGDIVGAESHCGQLWEVGSIMGAQRHCSKLGDLQLAGGPRGGRPGA